MGNPNKDTDSGTTESAESTTTKDARDACQAAQDLSWERDARDATLAKQVVEAIAWPRLMHTTRPYSMREAQLQCQPALR